MHRILFGLGFMLLGVVCAYADGAIAVGFTANGIAKDGVAVGWSRNYSTDKAGKDEALRKCHDYKPAPKAAKQCKVVGTFKDKCLAVAMDPKAGTPGFGWAVAEKKADAEDRALANCKDTAGPDRERYCGLQDHACDGSAASQQ
jgi:uncharacterized protein DUF4189